MERKEPFLWPHKSESNSSAGSTSSPDHQKESIGSLGHGEPRRTEGFGNSDPKGDDSKPAPNSATAEAPVSPNMATFQASRKRTSGGSFAVILAAALLLIAFIGYQFTAGDWAPESRKYPASSDTAVGCSRWTITATNNRNPVYSAVDICEDHIVRHLAPWLSERERRNAIASGAAGEDGRAPERITRSGSCFSPLETDFSNNDAWITNESRYCLDPSGNTVSGYSRVIMEIKKDEYFHPAGCARGAHGNCLVMDETVREQWALGRYETPEIADRGNNCSEVVNEMSQLAVGAPNDVCYSLSQDLEKICNYGKYSRSLGRSLLRNCRASVGMP